jgi:hypothetical protein
MISAWLDRTLARQMGRLFVQIEELRDAIALAEECGADELARIGRRRLARYEARYARGMAALDGRKR